MQLPNLRLRPVMVLCSAALVFALSLCDGRAASRPNILFIMSDDHAAHAVSSFGSKVNQTPNIDRLAHDGVRFANTFVCNSICTPSRATLLTGLYSHLNGTPVFNRFDGRQPQVGPMLQKAGYHTGVVGKWHLGSDPTGFDRWIVLPGQGLYNDPIFISPAGRMTITGYCTDLITDLGIEFLETRPKEKPFFLLLHHKAPHREWTPSPAQREAFKNRVIPEPETLFDDYATRPAALPKNQQRIADDLTRRDLKMEPPARLPPGPKLNQWLGEKPTEVEITLLDGSRKTVKGRELTKWKYQRYMQDYLACIQSMDDGIGRVLDYLDRTGLSSNTVVFYTSDNGFFLGDMGLYDKRFMYEPSLRIPMLVRWPAGAKRGVVVEAMALNIDWAPTFLDLAGLPIPPVMQGRSLVPLLKGETPPDWRQSMYYRYYHDPGHHNTRAHYGVRTMTHKLIYYWQSNAWEMFDLRSDPNEQRNLVNEPGQQEKVAELKAELARLKKEFKDDDQFARGWPKDGVDGDLDERTKLGPKTVKEAVRLSRGGK
jgi:arylsulfatase A-like enzyme